MPPKVPFLPHEATAVNEVSGTSPVHSELADVLETHFPTEQDSMYRPECIAAPVMASATQRMKCGGYWLIFPRDSSLSPPRLTRVSGSAKPQTTYDASSPSGHPNPTPGPGLVFNSHLPEPSYSRQCLQTSVLPLDPCLTAGRGSNGDASGSKGHISPNPPSLESLKRKVNLLQITIWILESDFLRLQLLEPIVGDSPMSYPSTIDDYGLRGQSVYTAFFDHLDMETFVCWECGHTVEEDLEVAIVHQRAVHFQHEPYRCHALNGIW